MNKNGMYALIITLASMIILLAFIFLSQQSGSSVNNESWLSERINEIYDAGFSVKYTDWVIWNAEPHFVSHEVTTWSHFFNSLKDSSVDPRRGRQCIWYVYIDKHSKVMWYELHDYVTYIYY